MSSPALQLVGISFLALFLELAMIRFINSTVQVIAYFNNFLILSAFLGLGLGSLLVGGRRDWFSRFPWVFAAAIASMVVLDGYGSSGIGNEQVAFLVELASERNLPVPLVVVLVFAVNLLFFVPLGFRLGQCLDAFASRLQAYAYDLVGSFLGVLGFAAVSLLRTPPVVWFGLGSLLVVLLASGRRGGFLASVRGALGLLALALGVFLSDRPAAGRWSPYYKITLLPYELDQEGRRIDLGFAILVDKLRIQDALRFVPELRHTPLAGWPDYYRLPYLLRAPRRVLILGGGSGNDATVALASGARKVDVVEIDPVIVRLGFARHPHRPYADPRVRVFNDDARAFLRRTRESYDVVVMNALDSHHQLPGLSTLRLESFIYTREAFAEARRLLTPDGLFVVHLSSTRPWMGERLYWTLTGAFGREPRLFTTAGSPHDSVAFAYGPPDVVGPDRPVSPGLVRVDPAPFQEAGPRTRLSTDDWPHLYLRDNRLPAVYVVVLGLVLVITVAAFRAAGRLEVSTHVELFLLGAGFMLLETRSITTLALVFGATWIVSAIVIAAILGVVFLGNLVVLRGRAPGATVTTAALVLILLAQYALPLRLLAEGSFALRLALGTLWVGLPVFLASLLFSQAFARVREPARAFGANLLGVVVGGILEYASMVFGLAVLSLIAGALYLGAAAARRARAQARGAYS